jgi:hypothetical protein
MFIYIFYLFMLVQRIIKFYNIESSYIPTSTSSSSSYYYNFKTLLMILV